MHRGRRTGDKVYTTVIVSSQYRPVTRLLTVNKDLLSTVGLSALWWHVKLVEWEIVRQLSTTPIKSVNRVQSMAPFIHRDAVREKLHKKKTASVLKKEKKIKITQSHKWLKRVRFTFDNTKQNANFQGTWKGWKYYAESTIYWAERDTHRETDSQKQVESNRQTEGEGGGFGWARERESEANIHIYAIGNHCRLYASHKQRETSEWEN